MVNQEVNNVNIITSCNNDDRLLINTDSANNILEQMTKENFIIDITSTDSDNIVTTGTDNKLFVDDTLLVHKSGSETIDGIKTFNDAPVASTASMIDYTDKRFLTDAQLELLTTFNGADELVQLNSSGQLPAIDGSLLTNISGSTSLEWEACTALYSKLYTISGVSVTSIHGLSFSSDGTKMYIGSTTSGTLNYILQFNLSTAFEVSTASYSGLYLNTHPETSATNIAFIRFNTDGTKIFAGSTNTDIYQYNLSTAWDISTATYSSKSKNLYSLSVSGMSNSNSGFCFSIDGTKLYSADSTNKKIFQFTLSTAWDISTATYSSKSKTLISSTKISDIFMSEDGAILYSIYYNSGTSNYAVMQYNLSTAWDISTATVTYNALFGGYQGYAAAGNIHITNNRVFITQSNVVYQYNIPISITKRIEYVKTINGNSNTFTVVTPATFVTSTDVLALAKTSKSLTWCTTSGEPTHTGTCKISGTYKITVSGGLSYPSTISVTIALMINGAVLNKYWYGNTSDYKNSFYGDIILNLNVGDTIRLALTSDTAHAYTIYNPTIMIEEI